MLNDATRLVNVISKNIDKSVKSGAGIELTYAQVYEVSGQECSVYLAGSREIATAMGEVIEPLQGFRIPGLFLVHAEDHVRVSIDSRGHRWVEDVIPLVYPRLAIDPNNGGIFTGDGITAPPWIPFSATGSGQRFIGACLNLSVPVDTEDGVEILVPWDTVEYDTDGLVDLGENGIVIPVGLGGFWRVSALVVLGPDSENEVIGHMTIDSGDDLVIARKTRPELSPVGPVLLLAASKVVRATEGTIITSKVTMGGGGGGTTGDEGFQEDAFQEDAFQMLVSGSSIIDGQIVPLEFTPDYTMFLKAEYRGPFAPVTVHSNTFTANASIKALPGGSFTANAALRKVVSNTFTADAYFCGGTVDAFAGATGGPTTWYNPPAPGTPNVWFDGDDTTIGVVSSPPGTGTWFTEWSTASPVAIDSIFIKWAYGSPPHAGVGGAGPFKISGSTSGSPGTWVEVLNVPDPVGTAGASFPGDFEYGWDLPGGTATYQYWRFESTALGNNDIKTLQGLSVVPC